VCCACSKKALGRLPYGWLRLLLAVHPESLPADRLLIRRDRKGRARYADMLLVIFCGAGCMERAMMPLVDLVRDLAARDVGMRPLAAGKAPPELPPLAVQGGPVNNGTL
jgi:hypothetical protein